MTKFVRQLFENNSGQDESHIRYPAGWQQENRCFPLGLLASDLLATPQTPILFDQSGSFFSCL